MKILPLFCTMDRAQKKEYIARLGQHIRRLRIERGYSYRQVAARCALEPSKISEIEKGKHDIKSTTAVELAVGLGVQPWEIYAFQ